MKAFKATYPKHYDSLVCIYTAESAGKVRYSAKSALEETGFRNVKFGDIIVTRAPEYDDTAIKSKHTEQIGWREYPDGMSYGVLQGGEVEEYGK